MPSDDESFPTHAALPRERRTILEAVFEGTSDAIFAKDLEGRYLLLNSAAASFLRGSVEECLGKSDWELFPEDVARDLSATDQRIMTDGRRETLEERTVSDGVETVWLSMKWPHRDAAGQVVGLIGIARDITQLRQVQSDQRRLALEARLLQSQKLESLGLLAGGVAHDFNNLLVAVLGNAEMALLELPGTSPARLSVQGIVHAAKSAADLCQQMLAYSGRGHFVVAPVDLAQLVRETSHLLEAAISRNARVVLDLSPQSLVVEADATQLRQVIMNLITNASESLGGGEGVVSLSTFAQNCDRSYLDQLGGSELAAGSYGCLQITDTGAGIDPTTLERIFDPFFSTKFTGRGLGLAAVQGIVRGHRGALQVRSTPGAGTCFQVLLPIHQTTAPAGPSEVSEPQKTSQHTGRGTILLVDDHSVVRRVGKAMIETLGFTVLPAASGQEALSLFRDHGSKIRCVLLDLTMPGLSGDEVATELRSIDQSLPIILCSGYGERELRGRKLPAGLGFLHKPFELKQLRAKLDEALPKAGER